MCLACAQRHTILLHFKHTWKHLADRHQLGRVPSQPTLGASYQLYRNIRTNVTVIGTVGYALPEVLHTHVRTVMPTTRFSSMEMTVQTPHRRSFGPEPAPMETALGKLGTAKARQPPPESLIFEPSDLRGLYGTVEYVPFGYHPGQNNLAVVGDVRPRLQDLTAFMDAYQEQNRDRATFTIQNVDGIPPNLWELPDATSNAAVQYATAMAFPTPLFVFRIERTVITFTQFLQFLLGMQPVPRTVGILFNYFLEHDLLEADAIYMCHLFEQFPGRGASVLVASGNDGVGAGECHSFHAEFPSSCTYDVCHPFQSIHKRVAHQTNFRRSLGHQRRRDSRPAPRGRDAPHRRWLVILL